MNFTSHVDSIIELAPIGFVKTLHFRKWQLPRQAGLQSNKAIIDCKGYLAREALEDLIGFDRIWIIFIFHKAVKSKSKVRPPRGNLKRGVLATRTPHHPNKLGMSCVELSNINDFKIEISNHDLLDGTPVLDIKPYIPYCDSFENAKAGWVDELGTENIYTVEPSELIKTQLDFLADNEIYIYLEIENILSRRPLPYPNHRVKKLSDNIYWLGIHDWRVIYSIEHNTIVLHELLSGYNRGKKPLIHNKFTNKFRVNDKFLAVINDNFNINL